MVQLSKKEGVRKSDSSHSGKSVSVRRMTGLSSTRLLAGVSVVVFLLMVTDPRWDTADLILQMYKCTRDGVGARTAQQAGKGFLSVEKVCPSQSRAECSVGAESRRNDLACYQVFLIMGSFTLSPWLDPATGRDGCQASHESCSKSPS